MHRPARQPKSIRGLVAAVCLTLIGACSTGDQAGVLRVALDRWPNGNPRKQESFYLAADGTKVLHGPQCSWFENGFKRLAYDTSHGVRDGAVMEWSSEGALIHRGQYVHGKKDGRWTWWQATGEKLSECEYQAGRPLTPRRYWDPRTKRIVREDRFDEDERIVSVEMWDMETGVRTVSETYVNDLPHGVWRYWDVNGQLVAQGEWRDGVPWSGVCGMRPDGESSGAYRWGRYADGVKTEDVSVNVLR